MPTYEYKCDNCSHQFEQFQSITANALKKCPQCGKLKLKRLIGAGGGVIFKGSGFYETDYRSDSYKKAAEKDTKPSDSKDKRESKDSSTTKKETKTETKTKSDTPKKTESKAKD